MGAMVAQGDSRMIRFALLILVAVLALPAQAWDRGHVEVFAVLPEGASGPEGLETGPDGSVYVTVDHGDVDVYAVDLKLP